MRISPLFAVFFVVSLLTLTVCIALIGILISENSKEISASQDAAAEMTGAFSLANTEPAAPAVQETQPAATPTVHTPTVSVTRSSSGSSRSSSTSSSTTDNSGSNNQNTNPPVVPPVIPDTPTSSECLEKYDLGAHTIIFYYANEPHSNTMKTIVQELQASYTFYWTNLLWDSYFNSCFGTSGATPTFVCAGTGEKIVGQVSESMLENFAERCA